MSLDNKKKPHVRVFILIFSAWIWLASMLSADYYGFGPVPNFMYYLFGIAFVFVLFKTVRFVFSELKIFFAELKRLFGSD
ncbi:hypothetical protein [uncultured Moraxella sp.]|uniref:hypothetical protein n=1 Tax=uncultured Moraxella sp. TaxID=263769 RepID=UPI0025E03643|nr:hypothetical protein [uncultured Moraxella sp.]